jgi:hypothetical protein
MEVTTQFNVADSLPISNSFDRRVLLFDLFNTTQTRSLSFPPEVRLTTTLQQLQYPTTMTDAFYLYP